MINTDLRKLFDTEDVNVLLRIFRQRRLNEKYIELPRLLLLDKYDSANDSKLFLIKRGIGQGYCLSSILFNYELDLVFDKWKYRLSDHGLLITSIYPRRIDISMYAKFQDELNPMMEILL